MANQPTNKRQTQVLAKVSSILKELSGIDLNEIGLQSSFLRAGLDSLFLIQLSTAIKGEMQVTLSFRQMIEEIKTFEALVDYIDQHAPDHAFPADSAQQPSIISPPIPAVHAPALPRTNGSIAPHTSVASAMPALAPAPPAASNGTRSGLETIINQQLQVMSMQLQLMQGQRINPLLSHPTPPQLGAGIVATPVPVSPLDSGRLGGDEPSPASKPFGAIARINTEKSAALTPAQERWLADFIAAYNQRTARSKAFTRQHHAYMADPRVVTGFKRKLKELVYPIVAERTAGCHIWDLDGNEYVDALNGFGSNFFGYAHPKITQAVVDQLWKGTEIGPQCPLVGDVAKMICDFSGLERAAFCNTGSEAMLGAVRIARTVTGRRLIVTFTDSYHGIFDEVLVRGTKNLRSIPASPGIMPSSVENVLVLDYGTEESLQILRERAHELAAVLVEPIQTRRPDFRAGAFLQEVRQITAAAGTALIFDEVVTGFRMGPGGAQAFFGVQADLAAYGKVIGGGLSVGITAGKRRFMDALDGGAWQYGDDSVPEVDVTYFAGTFVRHPAAIAACKAALEVLQEGGQSLYDRVNGQTARLVEALKAFFAQVGAPLTIASFASVFRLTYNEPIDYGELLFYLIRQHGVHIYDGFPCYLSLAHSDADIDKIIAAIKASVLALQQADFLPSQPVQMGNFTPTDEELADENSRWLPLSYVQKQYMVSATTEEQAFVHEGMAFSLQGCLDVAALERACRAVILRHDALRMAVEWRAGEWMQSVRANPNFQLEVVDGQGWSREELIDQCRKRWLHLFDLAHDLPVRLYLFQHTPERHTLFLLYHHVAIDGWSMVLIHEDLQRLYQAEVTGVPATLSPMPWSFTDHVRWDRTMLQSVEGEELWQYWQQQLSGPLPLLNLPTDYPRPANFSHRGDRYTFAIAPDLTQQIQEACQRQEVTPYMFLLAGFQLLLHHVSGQADILVGTMALNRVRPEHRQLVGSLVDVSVLRSVIAGDETFHAYLQNVRHQVLEMLSHPGYPYLLLAERLQPAWDASQPPMVQVVFNWEDGLERSSGSGSVRHAQSPAVTWEPIKVPVVGSWEDYFLMYLERHGDQIDVTVTYNTDLLKECTIARLMQTYQSLLALISANPTDNINELLATMTP